MFHEVVVNRVVQDSKGFDKSVTEKYLTENKEFLAESEQMVMQEFNGECDVTSVKQSKIKEFVNENNDCEQDIYLASIEDIFLDENTGEEKATKYIVGLFALSVEEATRLTVEYMRMGLTDLRLTSIRKTKYVGLLK